MVIGVSVQGLLADRYQLQELLGRGAMGEVWRAADKVLDRLVAVKLLRAEEAADAERFRLEAQTAASLNHPNVVGMYDFGSHQDQLYLVMEFVDGWSLAQERSLRGRLDPREAAAIAAQMAAGLGAAHQHKVIHRDVKPANVMLTAERTVKIADFGIARFADAAASTLTATGKILGTADYLAPERALGRPAQPASDVYSLGCVLYQLLTGRAPFSGSTSLAVLQQHVSAAPAPPVLLRPEIPQRLSEYVLSLLAKDPAHRPTAEQAADWLASHQPTPPAAVPELTSPMPAPLPPAAPAPESSQARTAAHTRPRRQAKLASRAVLGGTALVLFTAAVALGASLTSEENTPSSPSSPAPVTVTSTPPDPTPTSTPPSSSATASATAPAGKEHDDHKDQPHEAKHGAGKGKGRNPDD
ncbi:protein kinase domain-containing protein [Streptomyces sp. NRRL S-813]|uniref:protein kinase domain-containing protein n=1 Tax=Streptomyces sp. NRRL S-813 TaxID=1463919 RepID=UPI0004C26EA5|nr:protein kinase [Streptomyces sp. NRRL S-813]